MKKIKMLCLALLPLLLVLEVAAQVPKLKKTKINDAITVSLPENFVPVSEQEVASKYISSRQPLALYTSANKQADFSVNVANNQWQHFDLPLVKDFYKSSISNLYSEMEWLKEEVQEIRDVNFVVFEYVGTVADTEQENTLRETKPMKMYTYISYGMVEGKVVVFTFSAPASQRQEWAPVAEAMMESIRLKKTL